MEKPKFEGPVEKRINRHWTKALIKDTQHGLNKTKTDNIGRSIILDKTYIK